MSDLIERLEAIASGADIRDDQAEDLRKAATRIRELEADRGVLMKFVAELKAERDAIEAATIERCAQEAEWFINIERFTARAVAQRIRNLAKPNAS